MATILDLLRLLMGQQNIPPPGEPLNYGELGTLKDPKDPTAFGTERMIGVTTPDLYGGRVTNIPLLVKGQRDPASLLSTPPDREQMRIAIGRAIERIAAGEKFPNFATTEESNADAIRRHKILDTLLQQGTNRIPVHTTPRGEGVIPQPAPTFPFRWPPVKGMAVGDAGGE